MSKAGNGSGRLLEWLAALIGAANCILVPLAFAQSQENLFPLPGLYFIEIALVGVVVLAFVAWRPKLGERWLALPWLAAGIMLAFVTLGGFSIGFYLIPALIAFVIVGLISFRPTGSVARYFSLLLVVAVVQGVMMMGATLLS